MALGLEGVVVKNAKSPYIEGSTVSWHWQKIKDKNYKRQEKIEFHPRKMRYPLKLSNCGITQSRPRVADTNSWVPSCPRSQNPSSSTIV